MTTDGPKSSYELAMERLRKKDAEEGVDHKPITDAQREAIAEARRMHEAGMAERKIMHQSAVNSIFDPVEREKRDAELRRDLDRFEREFEEKLAKIRSGA